MWRSSRSRSRWTEQGLPPLVGTHPSVTDVLVEAVADDEFGQLIRATVEVRPGSSPAK
ncbi:hypothetical protein ACTI_49590 [Actinoplanes sp. OR16]|uniref:hypothetical protein n=1 Tax=Actinoplanes sp. OR16 TaxID=946334 RepID=UPI000F6E1471|nr:hypothetical protein [Actinoplanes sp. OR16]BBH68274.1 hypothetical protein ACTI_49590 [Actinoplanes sp. OR16]